VDGTRFGLAKFEVAIAAITKALAVYKDALAESKEKFPSAYREKGKGRGGCGNASGEMEIVQRPGLPEHRGPWDWKETCARVGRVPFSGRVCPSSRGFGAAGGGP
jgi:hypothetical protein